MPKVVFFTHLSEEIIPSFIQHASADFSVKVCRPNMPEADKVALAKEADFFILFPSQIEDSVLKAARKLKLIQLVSAGYDSMNLALCQELGLSIANNGGTNSIDVAEHTLALMLGFYRRMLEMGVNMRREGGWRAIDSGLTTFTIHGKTVGIIGLGQIGQRVARLLKAFGATCLYTDAYPAPPAVEQELGVTRVALPNLLQQADIVTLHVPLLPSTRGMINAEAFDLMKPTAILVNTCRGPVVDEAALIKALQNKRIAGAALDVLEKEPTDPNNPILQLDNVLLTPHTAGVTFDTWSRRGTFIFENLRRVWRGEAPLAVIMKA